MHIIVPPCINCKGKAWPPPTMPLLKSCQEEFESLHMDRCFIRIASRWWVTRVIFTEWAQLFCEWLEPRRADLGLLGKPVFW